MLLIVIMNQVDSFLVPFPQDPKYHLIKEQERFNRAVREIRSRVESPFSEFKVKFIALEKPFGEGELQHNYLLSIAAGVHNESMIY